MSAEIHKLKPKRDPLWEAVPGTPWLKRNRETGVYFVRKYKAGKGQLFKTTGERTVGRARTRGDEMIVEWLGGKPKVNRPRLVEAVVDELETQLTKEFEAGERRAKTHENDGNNLKVIRRLFGDVVITEIDEDWWTDWVRTAGRRQNRTLFDVAKYLSKTLTFAHRRKYIDRKPAIRNPDAQSKKGRVLTDAEVEAIVAEADPTLLLQITLGYECGLRTGEVRGLHWEWIDLKGSEVVVVLPQWFVKANARSIALSPRAGEMLKAWPRRGRFVFPAPKNPAKWESAKMQNSRWRKAVARAARKHGLTGEIRFYHLRHTFYNRALLELRLPLPEVSEYGGTSIRTLQRAYLQGDAKRTARVARAIQLPTGGKLVGKGDGNGKGV